MRTISIENQTALHARQLLARDFLWIVARDRASGNPVSVGFWSDLQTVVVPVVDPDTNNNVTREYYGAAGLVSIDDIPALSNVTVQTIGVRLSQLDEQVEQALKLYDVKQARIEIHRGLLDPKSRALVAPALCRFVGFVDTVEVRTPTENNTGLVTLTCTSHTQELMRSNPATRSHEDQKLRAPGDGFYLDAGVASTWSRHWGQTEGAIQSQPPKGIFGWGNFLGFL